MMGPVPVTHTFIVLTLSGLTPIVAMMLSKDVGYVDEDDLDVSVGSTHDNVHFGVLV